MRKCPEFIINSLTFMKVCYVFVPRKSFLPLLMIFCLYHWFSDIYEGVFCVSGLVIRKVSPAFIIDSMALLRDMAVSTWGGRRGMTHSLTHTQEELSHPIYLCDKEYHKINITPRPHSPKGAISHWEWGQGLPPSVLTSKDDGSAGEGEGEQLRGPPFVSLKRWNGRYKIKRFEG